jgi:hypothetical protein
MNHIIKSRYFSSQINTNNKICLKEYNHHLESVIYDANNLEFVPDKFKDKKMCMKALDSDGFAHRILEFVPSIFRDQEVCLKSIKKSWSLNNIPENIKNKDFYIKMIRVNGLFVRFVPQDILDKQMCMLSVIDSGPALEYIPEEFKDHNICLAAISDYGPALKYVPENLKTKELCLKALETNIIDKYVYAFIPERFLNDKEFMKLAKVVEDKHYDIIIKEE